MKLTRITAVVALLYFLQACGDEDNTGHRTPAEVPEPATGEPMEPTAPESEPAEDVSAVVRHMHLHASQLERLKAALAAGDLIGAGTPAYWLSRHESLEGIPEDWRAHLAKMRAEAQVIDEATELVTARAAAQRLEEACNGCHELRAPGTDLFD